MFCTCTDLQTLVKHHNYIESITDKVKIVGLNVNCKQASRTKFNLENVHRIKCVKVDTILRKNNFDFTGAEQMQC